MILILFLCLKLSILHLCVSDLGYECKTDNSRNDPEIFLIEDNNPYDSYDMNTKLINKFDHLCRSYYKITRGTIKESKEFKNVIRFAVPGYYKGKLIENFEYAGNITKTDDAECTTTNKTDPKFECYEIANLVSPSLTEIDDGNIYDFVQKMQVTILDRQWPLNYGHFHPFNYLKITHRESCEPSFQKTSDLTTVLLCTIDDHDYLTKRINIRPLTLIKIQHSYCPNYIKYGREPQFNLNRLLAVLAPEPFVLPAEYLVPTIFYETPYMFSEDKAAFPNSMNPVPWRLLKYGFLKFIQAVGWDRVAIVTDDSEYSIDFEDELIALFRESRLAFTVIRCEDANCEMAKISQELSRISARIVIANVERKNAQYMVQNASHRIIWLFRDLFGKLTVQNHLPETFSFSLHSTKSKECNNVEDNIITGLSSIAQAYKYVANRDNNVKQGEFYRRFADKMKEITPRITEAIIEVHRISHPSEKIASMSVNENGAEMLHFKNPYASGRPNDGTAQCLMSTYDFHKPCEDDPLVMVLMFTILLFVLTFLLILCFFDKTSPFNDIRYQNF